MKKYRCDNCKYFRFEDTPLSGRDGYCCFHGDFFSSLHSCSEYIIKNNALQIILKSIKKELIKEKDEQIENRESTNNRC